MEWKCAGKKINDNVRARPAVFTLHTFSTKKVAHSEEYLQVLLMYKPAYTSKLNTTQLEKKKRGEGKGGKGILRIIL